MENNELSWEALYPRFRHDPDQIKVVAEAIIEQLNLTTDLGAYVFSDVASIRERAAELASDLHAGYDHGPLHGIPYSVKDIYDINGLPSEYGSAMFRGHLADRTAESVTRLEKSGALLVGKTRTHEFAMAAITPGAHNPHDTERIAGGSSGGSGVAVASGTCSFSLGTDTGGSIRIPAAVCGTVGYKPAFGAVSRDGVMPLSWSLDHVGPLATSVRTAAVAYAVMAELNVDSLIAEVPDLVIGLPNRFFFDKVHPEVLSNTQDAIGYLLEDAHVSSKAVPIPPIVDDTARIYDVIWYPEAAAVHSELLKDSDTPYGFEQRAQLEAGRLVGAVDYINALRLRRRYIDELQQAMQDVDVIITPTLPWPAALIGQTSFALENESEEITAAYMRFCAPWNLAGFPAITVPTGFTSEGLPTGIQVISRPGHEKALFSVATRLEASLADVSSRK